jgi:anti-sigma factor (TIGR02949 family)
MKQDDIRSCRDLEERLTPYVDGEAAPDARRAVDVHLSACPPCREEMEVERAARDVLREQRPHLRSAAPTGLRARCIAHRTSAAALPRLRRWVPLSLAATVLLAVGAVFLFGVNDGIEALAAGLALDHVKCFKVSTPVDASADAQAAARSWQQAQGWPITVPESAPSERLRLIDVRRCLSTDGRVAHLMYLWNGKPLSVYVLPHPLRHDRVLSAMGQQTAIWSANGRTYAVIAPGNPEQFDRIVGYVKDHAR